MTKHKFDNGYGASVITNGYGGEHGLFEVAVLDRRGRLTYDTPITDDVIGWLDPQGVVDVLAAIAALPAAEGSV